MKVYIALSRYWGPEGGGDNIEGIFDTFEKAEAFVLKQIAEDEEWKYWSNRIAIDTWRYEDICPDAMSGSEGVIEEHEVQ